MKSPEDKNTARQVYVENDGNITATLKALSAKGRKYSRTTLERWKKGNDWAGYLKAYREKVHAYSQIVLDLDKQNLLELLDRKKKIINVMDRIDQIKQAQAYAQLAFSYLGIQKLIFTANGKSMDDVDALITEIINALFRDPVAGKVLHNRKKEILKLIKKK